jgi:hypothetical protein
MTKWIMRVFCAGLLVFCGTAHALIVCHYNEQGQFTGSDSANEGATVGGPVHDGSGDESWSIYIDAPNGMTCPKPNMPAAASTATAPGEFVAGGGSNGDDCFVLLRNANGHITQAMDAHAGFRFPAGSLSAISDARLVAASRTMGLVVHNDGSVSLFGNYGGEVPKTARVPADVTFIADNYLELHQNGSVSSLRSSGPDGIPAWTNVAAISSDGTYAVTTQGRVLGDRTDRGYPVFSAITTARAVAGNIHGGVALLADGTMVAWDRANGPSRNSDAYNIPHPPAGITGVTAIAAGEDFFIALRSDGTIVQWGWPKRKLPPAGLNDAKAIVAAPYCPVAAALRSDGSLTKWNPIN